MNTPASPPTDAIAIARKWQETPEGQGYDCMQRRPATRTHTCPACVIAGLMEALEDKQSGEPRVHPDTARLDWLNGLGEAYGFEDTMEGVKWVIDGPYNNVREGIDHGMSLSPTKEEQHGS